MNGAHKTLLLLQSIAKNPRLLYTSKNYIFIVSHIRSNSSLFSHILGSHPDISGHSEMHLSYSNWWDLLRLRCKVTLGDQKTAGSRFILDKILHNRHCITPEIQKKIHPRIIFLLRKPEGTLKSIINMRSNLTSNGKREDPAKALKHYEERLRGIIQYASSINGNCIFIASEQLIEDTDVALHTVSKWLQLDEELKPRYSVFGNTGTPGAGDPSGQIQKGEIIKTANRYKDIHIPAHILERAEAVYEECRDTLIDKCNCIKQESGSQ